ncbi:hypothetical protein COLO4_31695 [Corchorus olitorius]|uniref:Uncharacterized protein n=1 Tax=Corchorus olitorius TaxID=93759 RepID=A0A1R3H3U6_9ROSI|nr:hypothetical protein COLO4_31695 [Corchorus olitorius]
MASVVVMLNSISTSLPVPSQPAFSLQSNVVSDVSSSSLGTNSRVSVSDSNQSRSQSIPLSQNDVSITELNPR